MKSSPSRPSTKSENNFRMRKATRCSPSSKRYRLFYTESPNRPLRRNGHGGNSDDEKVHRGVKTVSDHYYAPDHLKAFGTISEGAPELGRKFFEYYSAVFAAGALTEREKALIALAVAHTVQCPYCIDAYTTECLQKGSDVEQMTEAVHVACAIRGGASLVHGMQMKEHAAKVGM